MPLLEIGDPAPWFSLPSTVNPLFHFNTVGGRRIVLFFFGSAGPEQIQGILKDFQSLHSEFSSLKAVLFGVSIDPADRAQNRLSEIAPSLIYFWDLEREVSIKYGVGKPVESETARLQYLPQTFVLNENLQVLNIFPLDEPTRHAEQVLRFIKALPAPEEARPVTAAHPPVLVIPNVLDKAFCQYLISLYRENGGTPSGFMREMNGKTVGILDDGFKKRSDFLIEDPQIKQKLHNIILRRVCPEVEKAFQFYITRVERYCVACYDAQTGGYFNPHRDNTSKGTAHRRFAMTLNLNVGEYTGGFLRFPEYSPHGYRHETGTAILFSCSLLHEATSVNSGQRFALLSFFYGEQDAKVREANKQFIVSKPSSAMATAPS